MSMVTRFFLLCLAVTLFAGCVNKPVRHLASDVSLITPGTSTRADVLTYLGDPDERRPGGTDPERWYYYEEYHTTLQRTLGTSRWLGPVSTSRIIVSFDGDTVADIQYNASESGEFEPDAPAPSK